MIHKSLIKKETLFRIVYNDSNEKMDMNHWIQSNVC